MSDNRPVRYVEHLEAPPTAACFRAQQVVYRASGLGGCERSIIATARGIAQRPHPEWFQEVLDEGTAAEPLIRAAWQVDQAEHPQRESGWVDQAELEFEVGVINGRRVIVRAHADDLYVDMTDNSALLREYKKFRDSTWPEFQRRGVEVQPYYPWQVSAMMWALLQAGHTTVLCQFVGGHWDGEQISEVEGKLLLDPPLPRAAILKRVARLERLIEEGVVPDEVECSKRFPCGHWFLHDDQDEVAEVATINDPKAGEQTAEWLAADQRVRQLKSVLEAAEKRKKQASEQLRDSWPAGAGKAEITLPDGGTLVLSRVVRPVAEKQIVRKGYTSDYFQKPRGS